MMNMGRARYAINLLLLAVFVVAPGCASKRPAISDTLMVKTPTIGVVLRATDPDVELQIPRKGWLSNAGRGAMSGAQDGTAIWEVGKICNIMMVVCIPAFAIIGAIGGGIYGGIHGGVVAEPASEWDQVEAAFKQLQSDLKVQQLVSSSVVEVAKGNRIPYRVIRVENEDHSSKDEHAAYRALASQGIDGILELTELAISLRACRAIVNPPRSLMMRTRARVFRTSDGALIDNRVITDDLCLTARGAVRVLASWTELNAQAFQGAVTEAADHLAQRVINELFSVEE
jgi:hypothetical protein